MKHYLTLSLGLLMGLAAQLGHAADLFPKGVSRPFQKQDVLEDDATMGGYAIYQGGRSWKILEIGDQSNNMDIKIGSAQLLSPIGNSFFAEMHLTTSLSGSEQNGYFSADVCSPAKEHLVVVKKASGTMDNCLTIDPFWARIGGRDLATLVIHIRNSQSNWRLYDSRIYLNLAYLGAPRGTASDWSADAVAKDLEKKQVVDKVANWAKQLQDAINKAIAYSKPQDAFVSVPPISSLLVVNEAVLQAQSQPQVFVPSKPQPGSSYVFCESTKKMVLESSQDCI